MDIRTGILNIIVAAILIAALGTQGCSADIPSAVDTPLQSDIQKVGVLMDPAINEASGMARSNVSNDLLWIVNDSGDQPVLYAVGTDGGARGRVALRDADNQDWEDLAGFRLGSMSYLLVADVGDNQARRPHLFIYILKEPQAEGGLLAKNSQANWVQKIQFTYEDGPRDCEAVAVDTAAQKILLLTKRDRPPRLYQLPLDLSDRTPELVARYLSNIETIPPPTAADTREDPRFGRLRSQPTAMDISTDGRMAVIQTYKHAYLYRKTPYEDWPQAFAARPVLLLVPRMPQTEAVSFDLDQKSIFVTTEQRPASLYRIQIQSGVEL